MDKTDAIAIGAVSVLLILTVGFLAAWMLGMIDLYAMLLLLATAGIIIAFLVVWVIVGAKTAITQKDQVHYDSSMTLDDITEVDREMEKK